MKTVFLFPLLLVAHWCAGQGYDRNWVFGINCGIDFNDLNNPTTFKPACNNMEANASISDSAGNLLFYLAYHGTDFYDPMEIRDSNNQVIINGDSIYSNLSSANGAIILPIEDSYYLFYDNKSDSSYLYYSLIEENEAGEFEVIEKNKSLSRKRLQEKIKAIKHPNGIYWWLICIPGEFPQPSNEFYNFLVTDTGISGPYIQSIGPPLRVSLGEAATSRNGTKVATIARRKEWEFGSPTSWIMDNVIVYDFDRCTGLLSNAVKVDSFSYQKNCYGLEFSPNGRYLYVTYKENYNYWVFQYDLFTHIRRQIYQYSSGSYIVGGGLELAPDNRIYHAHWFSDSVDIPKNQFLSVISNPDSSVVLYQPFSFFLGDSSSTRAGLPNIPNYNLKGTSIYQADAGGDTITICSEDTTVKGVRLGVEAVPGVTYAWFPEINFTNPDSAQQFVYPETTTWYYVTLTDTSIKYSCQSRTDSVLVEVRDCSVGVEEAASYQPLAVSIYPNPTEGILHVELLHNNMALHRIEMSDLSGKRLMQQEVAFIAQHTTLNTQHLAEGVYFVKVELSNGQSVVQKVVVR